MERTIKVIFQTVARCCNVRILVVRTDFVQLALQPCEHRKKNLYVFAKHTFFFAVLAWLQRQLNKFFFLQTL